MNSCVRNFQSDIFKVRNEVAKVMFLQVCVCPQGGVCSGGCLVPGVCSGGVPGPGGRGVPGPGGVCSRGVPGLGGSTLGGSALGRCLVLGGGVVSQDALRQTPPGRDSYCCGRYASYWNAFLFLCAIASQKNLMGTLGK